MYKKLIGFAAILFLVGCNQPVSKQENINQTTQIDSLVEEKGVEKSTERDYLRRFCQVAANERRKYGIPASVILANALRQSKAGNSDMTVHLNNHSGLPCTFDCSEKGNNHFRQYQNAWESFRDHSLFITSGKFSELKKYAENDYKNWALGLQRLGYPSNNDNCQ